MKGVKYIKEKGVGITKMSSILFLASLMFVACEKEPYEFNNSFDSIESFRAIAAAAIFADRDSLGLDPCGCYKVFDRIDYEQLSDKEVVEAINIIFNNLSLDQQIYLFEPVCGDNGLVIESACLADCIDVKYDVCSNAELDDYFFGGIDCINQDWGEFPIEIELPDGTSVIVNTEEELFGTLNQWYDENDDWNEEGSNDYIPVVFIFPDDCFDFEYPILIHSGGITSTPLDTVQNDDELHQVVDDWFYNNEGSLDTLDLEDFPSVLFPFEIEIVETNEEFAIHDINDFYQTLEENCD